MARSRHDADNVIVYEIDKVDAFLQFVFRGYSTEKEHLKKLGDNESSQRDCQILQLSQSGQVRQGDSLTGELWQVHRQPDNPAQQGGQERSVLLSRCPVPRRTGQWDRWDSMGQMGQAGQQEKQGRRSCLQDMKRRTNHEKQPAHGCMPADRIICRTWEHTTGP